MYGTCVRLVYGTVRMYGTYSIRLHDYLSSCDKPRNEVRVRICNDRSDWSYLQQTAYSLICLHDRTCIIQRLAFKQHCAYRRSARGSGL